MATVVGPLVTRLKGPPIQPVEVVPVHLASGELDKTIEFLRALATGSKFDLPGTFRCQQAAAVLASLKDRGAIK